MPDATGVVGVIPPVTFRAPCPACGLTADWTQQHGGRNTVQRSDFAIRCHAHCDRPPRATPCIPPQRLALLQRISERLTR